jgi:mannitol/fructose-specific phosphotransferase system IIA component
MRSVGEAAAEGVRQCLGFGGMMVDEGAVMVVSEASSSNEELSLLSKLVVVCSVGLGVRVDFNDF